MTTKVSVENRNLEVSNRNIRAGNCYNYVIYNGKIYQVVGSQGAGINFKMCLEKKSTGERIWIGVGEIRTLQYVTSQTGYMDI